MTHFVSYKRTCCMMKPCREGRSDMNKWLRIYSVAGIAVLAAGFLGFAQEAPEVNAFPEPPDRGATGLSRLLRELQTRASIALFTAHPDDEDGGMLAYETRGQGARGVLMTLNRGEGGQNAMSHGSVRRARDSCARRNCSLPTGTMGVDQYFTLAQSITAFRRRAKRRSKSGATTACWREIVRVIRMMRPLVITSVFVGAPTDGHGNHQVAGQMAQEAFLAAGDPTTVSGADPGRFAALDAAESVRARADFSRSPPRECTTTPSTNSSRSDSSIM